MKNKTLILASAASLLLASCENPADKTTNATVSDAVKVAAAPTTGGVKSADFFNVEKFSQSTFELTCLKSVSDDNYQVSGNLTLNGTSKNITFPASDKIQGDKAKTHAKFDINRKDFDIVYAGKADDLISDEVVIELKLEATPEA